MKLCTDNSYTDLYIICQYTTSVWGIPRTTIHVWPLPYDLLLSNRLSWNQEFFERQIIILTFHLSFNIIPIKVTWWVTHSHLITSPFWEDLFSFKLLFWSRNLFNVVVYSPSYRHLHPLVIKISGSWLCFTLVKPLDFQSVVSTQVLVVCTLHPSCRSDLSGADHKWIVYH